MNDDTREQWLNEATALLRSDFDKAGTSLPSQVKVSIGFPSRYAMAKRKQRIGECWDASATTDNVAQVFITPLIDDSIKILDVLVHELVHAAVGSKAGHKAPFKRLAVALGLTGKMTATELGPELKARLGGIVAQLGAIPHAKLIAGTKDKKQTTRLMKVMCVEDEYIVRASRKTLEMGMPICPVCEAHMVADGGEESEGE